MELSRGGAKETKAGTAFMGSRNRGILYLLGRLLGRLVNNAGVIVVMGETRGRKRAWGR